MSLPSEPAGGRPAAGEAGKLMSMADAVRRFVPDGASVAIGLQLEAAIPFAAGHEMIRQGRRDLTLIGPISDILFDQLIGAGCARKVVAAWVGNVSAGLGHNYRRAMESGEPRPLEVEDHSNLSIALALWAGAVGAPFVPTRTLLGSDVCRDHPGIRAGRCPWTGEPVNLVRAIRPDVAVVAVQRADADGHAHAWGNLGVAAEAAQAAQRVVLVAEEIRPREELLSDPNRILVPAWKVAAVVHEPWGCHPSPVAGHYRRDHAFYSEYHAASRTAEGMRDWLRNWVLQPGGRDAYLARLGPERRAALQAAPPRLAAPTDFAV